MKAEIWFEYFNPRFRVCWGYWVKGRLVFYAQGFSPFRLRSSAAVIRKFRIPGVSSSEWDSNRAREITMAAVFWIHCFSLRVSPAFY